MPYWLKQTCIDQLKARSYQFVAVKMGFESADRVAFIARKKESVA